MYFLFPIHSPDCDNGRHLLRRLGVQRFGAVLASHRNARIGQKSIQKIFENPLGDRKASKKVVSQLQYSKGAPETRLKQTLWVRRLEASREAWGQDVSKPFTGDDLIRFFSPILREFCTGHSPPSTIH